MLTRDEQHDIGILIAELRDEAFLGATPAERRTAQLTLNAVTLRLYALFNENPVTFYDRRQWNRLCDMRYLAQGDDIPQPTQAELDSAGWRQ